MKKLALILLLVVYTASVVGISINRFYCCGKLASTSVSTLAFNKGNTNDDDCCQHKQTAFKVSDNHEVTSIAHVANASFQYIHTAFDANPYTITYKLALLTHSNCINAPPLLPHTPVYTLLCNYRI